MERSYIEDLIFKVIPLDGKSYVIYHVMPSKKET